jgi:transposase
MKRRRKKPQKKPKLKVRELGLGELKAILGRAKTSPLSEEDCEKLEAAVDTLAFLTNELEKKRVSINRLRNMLFGASTEKTSRIVGGAARTKGKTKKKSKGHGRNGAAAYTGAEKVEVPHRLFKPGDACPECKKGKVYLQANPGILVRVKGMAPLDATVYERERFRCNLCGKVFIAEAPEGVGEEKYDETAASMVALLKYGAGLPFNRIEKLQGSLGIPFPAATQWEVVSRAFGSAAPAYAELVRKAAQGDVLHNDDTTMKILELSGEPQPEAEPGEKSKERTGVFTTGIISRCAGLDIALFFTGRKHAGENLADVLKNRARELPQPIQMCDGLDRNIPKDLPEELKTIVCNCNSHGRRKFAEVAENFPDECRHVLKELAKVYKNDAVTRKKGMTAEERLRFHQEHSESVMDDLEKWLGAQFAEKRVEPNSGLGEAISYMLDHWERLTRFLHVAGAPMDNNIVERALKKAILHRKNALFYKTQNGARVGDCFMSLIHTCELHGENPFDYLVALQRNAGEVARNPGDWMPWNYGETLDRLTPGPDPPQ